MWEVEKEEVLLVDGFCQWMEGGERGCCVYLCNLKKSHQKRVVLSKNQAKKLKADIWK